jgi:hypothetical protein
MLLFKGAHRDDNVCNSLIWKRAHSHDNTTTTAISSMSHGSHAIGKASWVTRDNKVTWLTRDEQAAWKARGYIMSLGAHSV